MESLNNDWVFDLFRADYIAAKPKHKTVERFLIIPPTTLSHHDYVKLYYFAPRLRRP
jgi:hypothetical protein